MKKLCVVILNYCRPELTIECLRSLGPEMRDRPDRCVVVVDNASGDDSVEQIENVMRAADWSNWARLIVSPVNGGFAAGNNIGLQAVEAEAYLLLNSDALVVPGALDTLLETMEQHPEAGLIGPRLQDPDGTPQVSCFRYRTPVSELLAAAGTGLLDRAFSRYVVALGVVDGRIEAPWISFACVLIRREVIEQIGLMDEQYFMYFEDIDYARRTWKAGWRVLHEPSARVVHLRGGSSSVKSSRKLRARVPKYYYASRSRYFAKFYGGVPGLWLTNALWLIGRSMALLREMCGTKNRHHCEREARDNWTNSLAPMRSPSLPRGGEM